MFNPALDETRAVLQNVGQHLDQTAIVLNASIPASGPPYFDGETTHAVFAALWAMVSNLQVAVGHLVDVVDELLPEHGAVPDKSNTEVQQQASAEDAADEPERS